tara:strand:- start:53 stop:2983 length:2931 start_codon:yes stop_codon:yes gene_type:complete
MKNKKKLIFRLVCFILFIILVCIIIKKLLTPPTPPPPPETLPVIGIKEINDRFCSHNGFITMISGYRGADEPTEKYRRNKIYLENCAKVNEFNNNVSTIALTLLQEKIPINIYARGPYDVTIGLILDTDILIQMGIMKCAVVYDDGSVSRGCHDPTSVDSQGNSCTCSINDNFKGCGKDYSNSKDYEAVLAGCGTKCHPHKSTYKCNEVYWCQDNYTDEQIIKDYSNNDWNELSQCKLKVLDKNNPKLINQVYIDSIIGFKKNNKPAHNRFYYENEIDGAIQLTEKNKNLWLKAIVGVFHDTNSDVMCACAPDTCKKPPDRESCCFDDDVSSTIQCQQKYCDLIKCRNDSIQCVKNMVDEYNEKVSPITGHKIRGWSMDGMKRNKWVGWEDGNYISKLKNHLFPISITPPESKSLLIKYVSQERNPYNYNPIDTISAQFLNYINNLEKDDVVILFTDYITFLDMGTHLKDALNRGANIIIGFDRWQICGDPYDCSDNYNCPKCDPDDSDKNTNCYCNFASSPACDIGKQLLQVLGYCSNNKISPPKNLIVIDQKTSDKNSELFGHSHRKMINFYYKSTNTSVIFKGSWNIADRRSGNIAIKESGIFIKSLLYEDFSQYNLRLDIDTLQPFLIFNNIKTINPLLKLKTTNNYPKLPIMCDIYWEGDDITKETYGTQKVMTKGYDKNVSIMMGISPHPKPGKNTISFDLSDKFLNTDYIKADYTNYFNTMNNYTNYIPSPGMSIQMNKIPWAEGATWSGTLMQKFFKDAIKSSSYIKSSMYIYSIDSNGLCDYNNGEWGFTNCTENPSHDNGWYSHGFSVYWTYLLDFINKTSGKVEILMGQTPTGSDYDPVLLNQLSKLPKNKTKNIYLRYYNQSKSGIPDYTCGARCGHTRCCKNHEKYYISSNSLLISSGHPSRGYYEDPNSINDDILFSNAPSLIKYYNDQFNSTLKKSSYPPTSKVLPNVWKTSWDVFNTDLP